MTVSQQLLHELFEVKAAEQPYRLAVDAIDRQLSYQELKAASDTLASQLLDFKVTPNQLIAIIMEKGWEQVVAVLAVLKAGAAYLPIDPDESCERIEYLLAISDAKVVLTQNQYVERLAEQDTHNLLIVNDSFLKNPRVFLGTQKLQPSDLAYVIFTSGSTGTPKGVMMSHESVVNTILDINMRFSINSDDKVLALSSLTFDLAVYDIFGLLAAGGSIVFPHPRQVKDPIAWEDVFFKKKITIWNSVPALIDIFVEYLKQKHLDTKDHPLRLVLMSGDWIPLNLPGKIKSLFPDAQTISLGGATEAAIWSIWYPILFIDPDWKSIPYGRAMTNQTFYILDDDLHPVECGALGELCIGGVGLAQGYWKEPELTREKFIMHPQYGRLYRTGDLGRYMLDGNIEFLGRKDFQVKIAGHRVEISGVEKNLLDFPEIKQAVVLLINDAHKTQLIAYVNFDYKTLTLEDKQRSVEALEQIEHWQKIYNAVFKDRESVTEKTFNISGWIDSNNQSIPKMQMKEWVENTAARVLSLRPQVVLEIGVGAGLIFFKVALVAKQYDATDIALSSIEYVRKQVERLGIPHANLIRCEANAIGSLQNIYDTVVLGSVVQYFPSLEYLDNVIKQSILKIKNKGHVFISDVRNLRHLAIQHIALLLSRNIQQLTYDEFKTILDKTIEDEDELIIDPSYFYSLKHKFPRITYVEILYKEGKYHNEMNCFRYDVILHIDQEKMSTTEDVAWIDYAAEKLKPSRNFETFLQESIGEEIIAVKNIPNKRTAGLSYVLKNDLSQNLAWLDCFTEYYKTAQSHAIEPSAVCDIAKENGYYAMITYSIERPTECFDLVLCKESQFERLHGQCMHLIETAFQSNPSYAQLSNFPLLPRMNRKLISKLKCFLKTRLPKNAIPSYFVAMNTLPMTANGKINRQALPYIIEPLKNVPLVLPTTEIQKQLMPIWEDILGIGHFGIEHNFYDLGGTSLLFVELSLYVDTLFGVKLYFDDIKQCQLTISNLSDFIECNIEK